MEPSPDSRAAPTRKCEYGPGPASAGHVWNVVWNSTAVHGGGYVGCGWRDGTEGIEREERTHSVDEIEEELEPTCNVSIYITILTE